MKRILYILSGLLVLSSCMKELDAPRNEMLSVDGTEVNGEFITVNFDVSFAEEAVGGTKAMANDPAISSLHIAVFDQYNMLEACVKATSLGPVNGTGSTYPDQNLTTWKYQATLPRSTEKRYLHFLANIDGDLAFGSEDELIGKLTTSGVQDAYWQRTIAEKGINVDEDGKLIEEAKAALTNVALVRNFAKITVTASANSNFTLKYAYLMNRPTSGTVAPYNSKASAFIDGYQSKSVSDLRAAKYDAWMPADYTLDDTRPGNLPGDTKGWKAVNNGSATEFTYERETPTKNASYLLVYGTYAGKDYYYKIDLLDKEGQYFPILRNFNYTVNILSVNAVGRTTVDDAINMQGSGSISIDVDAKNLVNISDGVSRMAVSFTEISVVSGTPFEFKYKFIPDFQKAPGTVDNKIVAAGETIKNETGKRLSLVKETIPEGKTEVFSFAINNNQTADSDGYYTIMIDPIDPSSEIRSQKMTLTGMAVDGTTISRDITIVVREKQQLKLFCEEQSIQKITGTQFDVVLQLPGGLTEMMFPLDVKIEASNLTIAPVPGENLPVGSGKSIALANPATDKETTVDKTAFFFTRTITWDEYYTNYVNKEGTAHELEKDGTKHFPCHFMSNTEVSATTIWAANKYFYTGSTELGNYVPYTFKNLKFAKGSSFVPDEEAIFTFDFCNEEAYKSLNDNKRTVTVTLVGLEPAPGSSLNPIGPSATITNGYEYAYKPTDATGNTLVLTATGNSGPYNVYLDAYHFEQAKGGRKSFTINKEALSFTSASGGPFHTGTKNETGKNVYVRADASDSDMTSDPRTSVKRSSYSSKYYYKNDQAITNCYANGDELYFLYKYDKDGKVYVGVLDVSGYTAESNTITSGTVEFTVRKAERTITVADKEMKVGESYSPTISYTPAGATGGTVTYTSSKPEVVAVSAGSLTAKSVGTATITATVAGTDSYSEASCTFKVTVKQGDLTLTPQEGPVEVGVTKDGKITFTYTNGYDGKFTVTSADPHRCSVGTVTASNGNGTINIKGVAATNSVKIKIRAEGNANFNAVEKEVEAKVVKLDAKLSAKVTSTTMKKGTTQKITVTKDSDATAIYVSSDDKIATVDASGNIKAVAKGKATITITVPENDVYLKGETSLTIEVNDKRSVKKISANSLTFTNSTDILLFGKFYPGSTDQLTVYVYDNATYSSSIGSTGINRTTQGKVVKSSIFKNKDEIKDLQIEGDYLYFKVSSSLLDWDYYAKVKVNNDGSLSATTISFSTDKVE